MPRPEMLKRNSTIALHVTWPPQVGNINQKMPVRILERREATINGEVYMRAYVCTLPSQSSLLITIALNEFNHSPQVCATRPAELN